ncbi:MAG: N,N-dimethylformamidase beta subunit family domain-containing protein [Marmoricola sp.]
MRGNRPVMRRALTAGLGALGGVAVVALVLNLLTAAPVKASLDLDACHPTNLTVPAAVWSAPGWTALENQSVGTNAWRPHARKRAHDLLQGFASQISVAPGSSFSLRVSALETWRWRAYRLGYYGGRGARLYASSCWYPPVHQARAIVSPSTRTVTAPWRPTVTIDQTWPPGVYLIKLTTLAGRESFVPLIVRSPSTRDRTVFMFSAMTMQAYNHWGGRSLYTGPDHRARSRAYADSFNRPFDVYLPSRILRFEQPLVAESERLGLPMAYLTDIDVATRPTVLAGARTLMTDGHDEYWTMGERQTVLKARDRGTNLLFFGANQLWWQVRLGTTTLGADHLVICYKTASDPITAQRPELRTTHFRYLVEPLPESRVAGVQFSALGADAPFRVYQPDFFAFANTGAHRGSAYPGLVGPEIDTVNPGPDSPRTLEIVGRSPATCHGLQCLAESTYYTVRSGAAVWAAGTDGWVGALGDYNFTPGLTAGTYAFVRTVTDNLLLAFAEGPAGRVHRARPNATRADGPPTVSTHLFTSGSD